MGDFLGHIAQMHQDYDKRRQAAANGALAQIERYRGQLLQQMQLVPQEKADEAIDRVGQLIESDLNGLWVRVDQDMSVFRDYVNNLGSNLGRELSPQEQEAYDALSSRVGEGHYDLQDWYTRKKDSALVQAKCRELQPAPPANAPLLPVKVAPGVTVQGGFGLPPPPPSYT